MQKNAKQAQLSTFRKIKDHSMLSYDTFSLIIKMLTMTKQKPQNHKK